MLLCSFPLEHARESPSTGSNVSFELVRNRDTFPLTATFETNASAFTLSSALVIRSSTRCVPPKSDQFRFILCEPSREFTSFLILLSRRGEKFSLFTMSLS